MEEMVVSGGTIRSLYDSCVRDSWYSYEGFRALRRGSAATLRTGTEKFRDEFTVVGSPDNVSLWRTSKTKGKDRI